MKRFHLVVFSCLVLSACSTKKQVAQSETKVKESVHKVAYIDTLLYTPASKAGLAISISQLCDSLAPKANWKDKSGNATAKAKKENDILYVTAECDSLELRAKIKQELIKDFESNNKERVEKSQKGVSGFQHYTTAILAGLAGIAIGIILKTFLI